MIEELLLDMSGILDEQTFHEYISKKLHFPGYYGYNLDALWDCITDEDQSAMPKRLIVEGLSDFKRRQPSLCKGFMECLSDYTTEFPEREIVLRGGSPSSEKMEPTVTLYRPTGPEELELVKQSGYTHWPPRLLGQPIFYPVTNEAYAKEIATKWNVRDSKVGYVTRFHIKKSFMDRYEIHQVGASHHTEWWIPAEELEELNKNIVGLIEVIGEYKG